MAEESTSDLIARAGRGEELALQRLLLGRTEQAVHMLCHRGIRQLHGLLGRTSDYLSRKE